MSRTCILTVSLVGALILGANGLVAEEAFQQRRAELIAEFDKNGDGKLNAEEREQMRLAVKERKLNSNGDKSSGLPADFLADYDSNKDGDMDERDWAKARVGEQLILTKKYDSDGDEILNDRELQVMMTEVRTVPMRYARDYFAYLLVYDKNKNGEFDGAEYPQAQAAEARIVIAVYDSNEDGKLDKSEKGNVQADLRNGTIVGFYMRFASEVAGGGGGKNKRGGGGGHLEEQKRLLAFDTDGDGLASADELKRIRESRVETQ